MLLVLLVLLLLLLSLLLPLVCPIRLWHWPRPRSCQPLPEWSVLLVVVGQCFQLLHQVRC